MKTKFTFKILRLIASSIFLQLLAVNGFSQTYNCYIENVTTVNSKTISFDVYIEGTGGSVMALQGFQAGINFNYDALANGGTITGSFLTGSADPTLPLKQQAPNWKINSISHQIQLFAAVVIPDTAATTIPSSSSGGIKLGTFQMSNAVDFSSGIAPVFTWSFTQGSITATKTIVMCYLSGNPLGANITNPASHLIK